ncbi:MAG: TROVE domain-containing protein [Pseudomonadota bacterium]|nr:TROVE domain-containing protein [Pseudomonadota bacterium]
MIQSIVQWLSTAVTPQSSPLPGQVPNSAGAFAWQVDDWTRLDRFLVLGAEGGSYYAAERTLTLENAQAVLACVIADGARALARIVLISTEARAPKNDAAIFALAVAMKRGDEATRRAAAAAVPAVCRTGTHLFQLATAVQALGGWGRGTKRAFARWYTERAPRDLAWQLVKYQSRAGFSHRDVLRLAKPKGADATHDVLFRYATRGVRPEGGLASVDPALILVDAVEAAKTADRVTLIRLIVDHALPWECVPTVHLGSTEVWDALLHAGAHGMPFGAMLRNLARMTSNGLLKAGAPAIDTVVARLADGESVRRARVHPLSVLAALVTYQSGKGARGSLTWAPAPRLVKALDRAFYDAFANVAPTGKRWMLAVDVSGSMDAGVLGGFPGLTPRIGAAAMAMVTARTERSHEVVAFTAAPNGYGGQWGGGTPGLTGLDVAGRRLDDVVGAMRALPMGGTDCALPMVHALRRRIPVDVFVVYTDSETWAGSVHPAEALRAYRQAMGIPAKLVVVGMVSNQFTIADPDDAGMLDVVGFDAGAPAAIGIFAGA